ncbi:MAG TPA: YceI family protein [Cyclobacteriaceae bacterium]|jgi:polyisoprenoid-binding protein YceI|nr:YceI family protein [Cytophagales bacterium]HMR55776.1 YceI family protein [Cyclobacteriaceae bacterium]HNT50254.1 YceI family protein [Cyclobacteriaceae bacterium]HRE65562.1 YceI family protein [Cyclobacteriaceae bacterium]HRF32520.1 YceI family protein [Cyclobacteriaceae bacterium]
MKYFFLFILWALSSVLFAQTELKVVRADSKVTWTGTKVIGYHQGIVKIKEGKVKVKDEKLIGGYFVIDMTTITCTDIPDTDPIPKKKLESHLKDADFFDVAKYPTAKFEIIDVRNHPDDPTRLLALGNLTIKGITKRWKIEVEPITQTEKIFMAQARMQFDRQLFGVAYTGIKDELVHDLIKLNITIKAE